MNNVTKQQIAAITALAEKIEEHEAFNDQCLEEALEETLNGFKEDLEEILANLDGTLQHGFDEDDEDNED